MENNFSKCFTSFFEVIVRLFLFGAVTFVVAACGIVELGSSEIGGPGIWVDKEPNEGKPDSGQHKPTISQLCYMTTIEYPPGYDWKQDLHHGTVRCSLVVYVDGSPRMKLAVGDAHHISSDSDMHRIVNGDLYTDYSTDKETIIKQNGLEILRWQGLESIIGLKVIDADVYTLGQNRSGFGFSLRRNGEIVISDSDKSLFNHFDYSPEYGFSFAFVEVISSQSSFMERYYIVKGNDIIPIEVRSDVLSVLDVVMLNGKPCYVASLKGTEDMLFAYGGDEVKLLKVPDGGSVHAIRLFTADSGVYVVADVCIDSVFSTMVWKDGKVLAPFPEGMTLISFIESGGNTCFVLNSSEVTGGGLIRCNGEDYPIDSGYISEGAGTSAFVNGICHIGLASLGKGRPMLWKDGICEALKFNGYITSVTSVSTIP